MGVRKTILVGPDEEVKGFGRRFNEAESMENGRLRKRGRGERRFEVFGPGGFVGVDELGHGSCCFGFS